MCKKWHDGSARVACIEGPQRHVVGVKDPRLVVLLALLNELGRWVDVGGNKRANTLDHAKMKRGDESMIKWKTYPSPRSACTGKWHMPLINGYGNNDIITSDHGGNVKDCTQGGHEQQQCAARPTQHHGVYRYAAMR